MPVYPTSRWILLPGAPSTSAQHPESDQIRFCCENQVSTLYYTCHDVPRRWLYRSQSKQGGIDCFFPGKSMPGQWQEILRCCLFPAHKARRGKFDSRWLDKYHAIPSAPGCLNRLHQQHRIPSRVEWRQIAISGSRKVYLNNHYSLLHTPVLLLGVFQMPCTAPRGNRSPGLHTPPNQYKSLVAVLSIPRSTFVVSRDHSSANSSAMVCICSNNPGISARGRFT